MEPYMEVSVPETDAEIESLAKRLDRHETSLLELKAEGKSRETIEACFLLSECSGSLLPEKIEWVRANPLAKRLKEKELLRLIEQGDREESRENRWQICRTAIVNALEILRNGLPEEPHSRPLKSGSCHGDEPDDMFDESLR